MKKSRLLVIVAILAVLLVGYASAFTVGEAEQVVILQFGEVKRLVAEPGLSFKIPFLQEAKRFEKRWLEWDGDANQITTLDKRYIYIDVFARWRISEPLLFIETLRNELSAQSRLDDIIDNATRNVIAGHNLIEVIRSTNRDFAESDEESVITGDTHPLAIDPALAATAKPVDTAGSEVADHDAGVGDAGPEEVQVAAEVAAHLSPLLLTPDVKRGGTAKMRELYAITVGRDKLTRLILEKAMPKAAQLGIELKDVQIKRVNYIETVQTKVFDRMISERQRVAEAFRSQGRGRSAEIMGQKARELKIIRSEAYRISQEIMGRADGEAAAIYAEAYKKDPEFYNFVKTMESYQTTIDSSSWLLLTTDADYLKHLQTMKGSDR
jgi:modulator of FtsH protease HflC